MADGQNVNPDDLESGLQDYSQIKGSMSYRMEHPDEEPEPAETPEEKAARESAEAEAAEETPEQKAAREQAEQEAATAEADKPKFATVEEYHKAYKEAETRMHTATGETAKEKAARKAAEKRADEAERKLAEQETEKTRLAAEAVKPKPLSEDEQDAVFEKAVRDLADLETADENYHKNYAKIWRKAVIEAGQTRTLPDSDTLAEEAANKAWEKIQAKQAAETAKTAEERQKEADARIRQQAIDYAKQAGLDMTPGSADYRMFFDVANNDLGKQDFMAENPPPIEDQFKWVTDESKRILGKKVEQTEAERQAALANQRRNTPLGKGGNPPPREEFKPKSFSERLDNLSP